MRVRPRSSRRVIGPLDRAVAQVVEALCHLNVGGAKVTGEAAHALGDVQSAGFDEAVGVEREDCAVGQAELGRVERRGAPCRP
jgi:hypothetical protein